MSISLRAGLPWAVVILSVFVGCGMRQQLEQMEAQSGGGSDGGDNPDSDTGGMGGAKGQNSTNPNASEGGFTTVGLGGADSGIGGRGTGLGIGGQSSAEFGGATSGIGGASIETGVGGFGGLPYSGYCVGTSPKIQIGGRDLVPNVTQYTPDPALGNAYGLSFNTTAELGFNLYLEITATACPYASSPLCYCYADVTTRPQAKLYSSAEVPPVAHGTQGTLRYDPDPSGAWRYQFGVCVEVVAGSSDLLGTKIFVPSPNGGQYY